MLKMTFPKHNLVTKFHKTPEICKHLARNLVNRMEIFLAALFFQELGVRMMAVKVRPLWMPRRRAEK